MIGETYTRWTVVEKGEPYVNTAGKSSTRLVCKCVCGTVKLVHKSHLLNKSSQSCGCLAREISTTHGLSNTRAYKAWDNMIRRCDSPSAKEWTYVGIKYAPQWADFMTFYKDMGPCPDSLELERLDSAKDYTPDNCCWNTETVQATNRARFKNNTSGRTGIGWSEVHGKWRVGIQVNNRRYEGGLYEDFEAAVKAREQLEIKHLGSIKDYA